jgi:hypothetical protein
MILARLSGSENGLRLPPENAHQIANYCTAATATTLLQVVAVPEKLVCERVIRPEIWAHPTTDKESP